MSCEMVSSRKIDYYVNEGQGGITQDWNFGYKCALEKYHSEYITIAHQDDYYEAEYLSYVLKEAKNATHPLIIFGDYYEIRNGCKVYKNRLLKIKRLMLLPLRVKILQKSKWIRRRILSLGSPICCPSVTFSANNLPDVIFENHYRACGGDEPSASRASADSCGRLSRGRGAESGDLARMPALCDGRF